MYISICPMSFPNAESVGQVYQFFQSKNNIPGSGVKA